MTPVDTPAEMAPHDFAALKRACDAVEGACGMRLWRLARQIAQFAAANRMTGIDIARGIGRSRGYVSRALKVSRLPEPHTIEDGQRIYDAFHGVSSLARSIRDSAAALKRAQTWARLAVKRGARPEAVKLAIDEAITDVLPVPQPCPSVSTLETSPSGSASLPCVSRVETPTEGSFVQSTITSTRAIVRPAGTIRRMTSVMPVVLLLAMLALPAVAQLPCSYEVDIVFGPACGDDLTNVSALGISEEGDICGDFSCPGGLEDAYVAWDAAKLIPLMFPPGTERSFARDIKAGRIVGHYELDHRRGFMHDGALLTEIAPPVGANWVEPEGINSVGIAVGAWGYSAGPFPLAFRWANGVMQDISVDLLGPSSRARDINDNGAITGWMGQHGLPGVTPGFEPHAFIWHQAKIIDLGLMPGSIGTEAQGINNHGDVCGSAWFLSPQPPGFVKRGFVWSNGVFTDIGVLPGHNNLLPAAIADDGTVVGVAPDTGDSLVWKAGVLRRISDLLPPNVSGICRDINSRGEIAFSGNVVVRLGEASEQVGVRLRPVPRQPGDTNCDKSVDVDDLMTVIIHWSDTGVDADVDGSGLVDLDDLMLVLMNWQPVRISSGADAVSESEVHHAACA